LKNLFSILLPTFNRANTIKRTIDSVLLQTYTNFELIIIDDGSTDHTEDIVNSYLAIDNRLFYYKNSKNLGQNASLNKALQKAKGDIIAFIDSDDYWLVNFLEKHNDVYLKKIHSCVYSRAQYIYKGEFKISKHFELEGKIYNKALKQGYVSHMITLSAKKECFDIAGVFDEDFVVCQDDDICLRLAKYYSFGLIKDPLAVICNDGGNQTITNRLNYAIGWEKLINKFNNDVLNECGIDVLITHYKKAAELYAYALYFKKSFLLYKKYTKKYFFIDFINYLLFLSNYNKTYTILNIYRRKFFYDK
jgi:glycosyltransferase involved in cell wall biosynthesis